MGIGSSLIACTREFESPRVPESQSGEKVASSSSRFKWVRAALRVRSKPLRVHSSALEPKKTHPRRTPHGADAGRAPTNQQAHETPRCTACPRSPTARPKATYTKSDAPFPDAMKLLWEVLRR